MPMNWIRFKIPRKLQTGAETLKCLEGTRTKMLRLITSQMKILVRVDKSLEC